MVDLLENVDEILFTLNLSPTLKNVYPSKII